MEPMHNLLKRQVRRHLEAVDTFPGEWLAFLAAVNDAYLQSDTDRAMLERSLELSSLELHVANSAMRAASSPLTVSAASRSGIRPWNSSSESTKCMHSANVPSRSSRPSTA